MDRTLRSRDELNALHGLITAAMADCDAPGADAADREEWQRLFRYRAAVQDALRGVRAETGDPDSHAMADWLVGAGPNPLTAIDHSLVWRTSLPDEAPEEFPDDMSGSSGGLTIRAITASEMPDLSAHLFGDGPYPIDEHYHASGVRPAPPAQPRPANSVPGAVAQAEEKRLRAERDQQAAATVSGQGPQAGVPTASTWMNDVLALAQPVAGRAGARHVPPHPVAPEPRRAPMRVDSPKRAHAVPDRDRIWLDVPYDERRTVSQRGAVWDPVHRSWYAPHPGIAMLASWARLPEVLAGEERTLGQGLFVDLIPSTSWFVNVRSAVSARDWYRVRQMVYRRAGHRCEACGAGADKTAGQFLECHERFSYQARPGAASGVQVLRRLICLCSACHRATHFGHASLSGDRAEQAAMAHLMVVTGMDARRAAAHVEGAFRLWTSRSARDWTVDLSLMIGAGIKAGRPEKGGTAWVS